MTGEAAAAELGTSQADSGALRRPPRLPEGAMETRLEEVRHRAAQSLPGSVVLETKRLWRADLKMTVQSLIDLLATARARFLFLPQVPISKI